MKTILLLLACPLIICAQTPAPNPAEPATPETRPTPVKRKPITFSASKERPTAPRNDGDGASRSDKKIPDLLLPLIPKDTAALTTHAQPTLFTFISNTTNCEFRVSILEGNQPRPAFIFATTHAMAGIRRVDLADFGVTLKPGVEYRWMAIARPDSKQRSGDLTASGYIKRIVPDAALAEKIDKAAPADLAAVYAEAGIWYDALAAISDQIAANPKDADLVAARKDLLEQAGLKFTEGPSKISPKAKTASVEDPSLNLSAPSDKSRRPRVDGDGANR